LKKILGVLLAVLICTAGCGKKDAKNIISDFQNKVDNTKSYTLKGNMEIYADTETFTYSLEVDFLKDNFYKVKMINQTNNHEQIILRNSDAVYVITPSLNKSFKFQSEWPDNSSQAYLLKPLSIDIKNDTETSVEKQDDNYIVKSKVNYPNNPELNYQKITFDKDGNIKKNEIYNEKNELKMKVTFTSIDYKANLKEDDFKLTDYIKEDTTKNNQNNNTNNSSQNNNQNTNNNKKECESNGNCQENNETKCEGDSCSQKTGVIENILYPLYIPSNTYLSSSDKINTDVGNRIILTFAGDKNFVLVEETASASSEFEIIPVYGDPLIVNDTIGALGANSLTWTKDNINYYLTGNDLTTHELLTIGESIGYNNQTVSKEK